MVGSRLALGSLLTVMVVLAASGCAGGPRLGERRPDARHKMMEFVLEDIEVRVTYQDPSLVDLRLGESRVVVSRLEVRNRTAKPIRFERSTVELNVGLANPLATISADEALDEIRVTEVLPTFLTSVVKLVADQSSAFVARRRGRTLARLNRELNERSFVDQDIPPGETRSGLIFFRLPEQATSWADLRVGDRRRQAIATKGQQVSPDTGDIPWWRQPWVSASGLAGRIRDAAIGAPPPANGAVERSVALLVGVGAYNKDEFRQLKGPRKDVAKMRRFLERDGFEVIDSLDSQVTREHFTHAQSFFEDEDALGPADRFLFYYSGHGFSHTGEDGLERGYLPLVHEIDDERWLNSIPMADLVEWLKRIPAARLLVVLDCCVSGLAVRGALAEAGSDESTPPGRENHTPPWDGHKPARKLLMAGDVGQNALEGDAWGGSLFTHAIIKGVQKNAGRRDLKIVTVDHLVPWLKEYVADQADHTTEGPQTPLIQDLFGASPGKFFFRRR